MDSTSPTLLLRVKNRHDKSAWNEFAALYTPILKRYGRHRGLSPADAEDVAQDCMHKLLEVMPRFDYDRRKGKFKNYIFTIVNNNIINRRRRREPVPDQSAIRELASQATRTNQDDFDQIWEKGILEYCLARVEEQLEPDTVAAFKLYFLMGRPLQEVCTMLNMADHSVYNAKSRIIKRLKEECIKVIGETL